MESKAQQDGKSETTDATNEKKTVGDNLISIDQTEALDNTLLHTEGISPKTSDATNENENLEEGISTKSSDASNKKGIGKGGISPKTTSVTNKKEIGKRPLPKPPTKQRNPQNISTPQIQNLGEVGYHGRIALSRRPLPRISPSNKEQKQNDSTHQQDCLWYKKASVERRASSVVMGLKGIVMVATVVLISSSEEISKTKSCDLEKALKLISLNYTVSCEYDDIRKNSKTLRDIGISLLILNLLFFLLILVFTLLHQICKLLVCISLPLIGIFSVFMILEYNDILHSKMLQKDMDYVQLQSAMAIWLEAHYTSDNISSSDEISNSWNKFFIEYDCCAIHQVTGTTNDFDNTPWCTTSGTCQATASQIPRTCCKYVSEDDYGSALFDCHSSVTPGTFRSNCMNVIKQLSVVNIEECQLSLLQMSLIIIATLELVATALEIIATIIWIILWALDREKSKKEDIQPMRDLNKSKSEKEVNLKKVNKKK
eukprot:XP_011431430.1 PREDICTED: uncharacterized protein LOC105331090 [Crassostrea gigas]